MNLEQHHHENRMKLKKNNKFETNYVLLKTLIQCFLFLNEWNFVFCRNSRTFQNKKEFSFVELL